MKDALGNELALGDPVHIKVAENIWVVATIVKMSEGGLSLGVPTQPGQPAPQVPDCVVVQLSASFSEPHGMPHGAIVKLVKPDNTSGMIQ
jgi:hypothetical protein